LSAFDHSDSQLQHAQKTQKLRGLFLEQEYYMAGQTGSRAEFFSEIY